MTSLTPKIDPKQLQTLIPLNALTPSNFTDVTSKANIETLGAKRYLFKIGDGDEWTTYILKGKVSLLNAEGKVIALIEGGSGARSARHPLDPQQPHTFSARAETEITCLRVNSNLLDLLLTWDQSSTESGYEVDEPEENWMSRLLQSPIFQQIPAINIPKIIAAMSERPVQAGEVIVRQHDIGDYYYYIQEGRCEVVRQTPEGHEEKLAELGHGATFGEEALLSDARRNATVRMLTAGSLMALAKADFVELIKAPLEHEINYTRSKELIEAGATWIDVRLREEYENSPHFANSLNLPLQELRELAAAQLNTEKVYVVCCDTGRRAAAGAFILNQRNFHAYALRGGLHLLPDSIEWAKPDADETPTAITQAYDWNPAPPVSSPIIPDDTLKIAHQLQEKAELARKKADTEVAKLKQLQLEANEKLSQAAKIRTQADAKLKQAHLLQQQLATEQQNQAQQSQKQQHLLKIAKAEALKLRAEREQVKAETAHAQAELERARLEMAIAQQTQAEAQRQLETAQQMQTEAETTKQTATAAKDQTQALSLEMQEQLQQEIDQLQQKTAAAEAMAQQALAAQQAAAAKLQQAEQLNANALATQQATANAAEKIQDLEQQIRSRNQQLLEASQAQQQLAAVEQRKAQQLEVEAETLRAEQIRLKAEMEQLQFSANTAKQDAESAQHTLAIAQQKLQEAQQLTLAAEQAKQTAEVEATETRAFAADMQQKIQQEVERLQQQSAYTTQMAVEAEQAQQQAALKLQQAERLKAEAEAAQQATAEANRQLAALEQQIQLKLQQEQAATTQLKAEVEMEKRVLQQETEKLQALHLQLQNQPPTITEWVIDAEPAASSNSAQEALDIKALQAQAAQKLREAEQLKVLAEKTREAATQEANRIRLEHEQAYRQLQQEVQQLQSQLSSQHSQQEETANIRQEYEALKREREQMQAVVAHANQKLQEAMRLKTQAQTQHAHPVVYPIPSQQHQQLEQAVRLKTEAEAAKSVAKAEIGRIDHALKQSQQAAQLKSSLDTTSAQVASLKEAKDTIDNLKKSLEQARQRTIPEPDLNLNPNSHTRWIVVLAACLALLITGAWVLKSQWAELAQQITTRWQKTAPPTQDLQVDTGPLQTRAEPQLPPNLETPALTATPPTPADEVADEVAPTLDPTLKKQPIPLGKLFRDALAGSEQNFGPSMITIAAGSFTMGNTLSTAYPEERPPRTVAIPAFAISQYEISFDEYEVFTHRTGQRRPDANGWGTHRRPVINVSWQEASDYASWLSKQTRHNYRLPTEAEWEYAAGAGQNKLYWWGNRLEANIANCYDCGSIWDGKKTAPIGSFPQNPFGLFDVAGNVAEWVQDCDHPNYVAAPTDNRGWLSGDCAKRIVRGGSYRSPDDQLITTRRKALLSTTRADHLGFRLVREN